MQTPTSLKGLFQSMTPPSATVIRGKVIAEKPLAIQVVGDEKLILRGNIICLPKHLTEYKTTVDIDAPDAALMGVTMTVHNELKAGETVYILSFNHGKKYYILDREE